MVALGNIVNRIVLKLQYAYIYIYIYIYSILCIQKKRKTLGSSVILDFNNFNCTVKTVETFCKVFFFIFLL